MKDGFMSYDYELLSDQNYNSVDCYRIKYTPKRKDVLSIYGCCIFQRKLCGCKSYFEI